MMRVLCAVVVCLVVTGCAGFFPKLQPDYYVEMFGTPDATATWAVSGDTFLVYRWRCVEGERVAITWKEVSGGHTIVSELRSPCP